MFVEIKVRQTFYDPVSVVNDFYQSQFGLRPLAAREWALKHHLSVCAFFDLSVDDLCKMAHEDHDLHVVRCRGKMYAHPDSIQTWYNNFAKEIITRDKVIH